MSAARWDFRKVRVGVVARAVFIGEALGFGLHMQRRSRLEAHFAYVEVFEDVEHLQRGETLRVGGHGIDLDAAVSGDERLQPFSVVGTQVSSGEPTPDALEVRIDGLRDGAVVVCIAAAGGDEFVGTREIRIAEDLILVGWATVRRPGVHGVDGLFHAGVGCDEGGEILLDGSADNLRYRRAVFAVMDRRLEEFSPFETAIALVHSPPAIERAGRGDGDRAVFWEDSIDGASARGFERERLRRFARTGHGNDFAELRVPDEREAVTADARADGFDETEHSVGGNGCIDSRAAALEGRYGGLRGDWMRGAGGATASQGGRACGEACAGGAIAGVDIGAREALVAGSLELW